MIDSAPHLHLRPVYLADTSALARLRLAAVADTLEPLIERGLVAHCGPVDMEMLRTARNAEEIAQVRRWLTMTLPLVPITQEHFERAMDVMTLLAADSKHHAAKLPDLLIAAVAEGAGLILIHYDSDFDHIAGVTGQKTQWVAPRGSLEPG